MRVQQDIHIPDNIATWINEHNGVNLSINFNNASGDAGYAHVMWYTVEISMLTRTCNRCGYDVIWNPDDSESKCIRHTYNAWRYDTVFAWSAFQNTKSLEDCFDCWLKSQSEKSWEPIKKMHFGQIGWK